MSPEAIAARVKYFEEKKKKGKKTPTGITNNDIEIALRRFDGNMSHVADFLGMHQSSINIRVLNSPHLQKIRQEIIDEFLDTTESELKRLVKSGNPSAIIFVLKTLGKNRGYTEKSTVEHELGPYAAKNAASLIEAMRRGAEAQPPPKLLTMEDEDEYLEIEVHASREV